MIINLPKLGPVKFRDDLTQEQFQTQLQALSQKFGFELPRPEYGIGESFTRGVSRGLSRMGSVITDTIPALVGSAIGNDEYARQQLEEAAQKEAELQRENPAQFTSYKQAEGLGGFARFGAEALGETVPDILGIIGTGGVGGALAKRGAVKGAEQIAENIARREAVSKVLPGGVSAERAAELEATALRRAAPAIEKAQATGQAAGIYLGSYATNTPDVFQSIYEQTGELSPGVSLLFGGAVAALDAVLPSQLAKSLTQTEKLSIAEKILERSGMKPSLLRKATAIIPETAAKEGLTEGAQEVITAAAEKFVDSHQDIWDSDHFNRYIESAVRGAVAGAPFGGVQAVGERMGERGRERQAKQAEEARAVAEQEAQAEKDLARATGEGEQLSLFKPEELPKIPSQLEFPSATQPAAEEVEEPVTARTKYKDEKAYRESQLGIRSENYVVVPNKIEGQLELFDSMSGKPTPMALQAVKSAKQELKDLEKAKIAEGKAADQAQKEALAELAPQKINLLDYANRVGIEPTPLFESTPLFQLVQQATQVQMPRLVRAKGKLEVAPLAAPDEVEKQVPIAPTKITKDMLVGLGLKPSGSGPYKALIGKDFIEHEDEVRAVIDAAKDNANLSPSTVAGLQSLEDRLPLRLTQPTAEITPPKETTEAKPEVLETTPPEQGQLFSRVARDFKGMSKEELETNAPVLVNQLKQELEFGVSDKGEVLDKARGLFDALWDADLLSPEEVRHFRELDKVAPATEAQKPGGEAAKRSKEMQYLDLINMLNLERHAADKARQAGRGRPPVRQDIQEELNQYNEPVAEQPVEEPSEEGASVEDPEEAWNRISMGMVPYNLNEDGKEIWAGAVEGGYADLKVANQLYEQFGEATPEPTDIGEREAAEFETPKESGKTQKNVKYGDPSKEESDAVAAGVGDKSPIEAAKWIAANAPNASLRIVAEKVVDTLQRLQSVGLVLPPIKIVAVGDSVPRALLGARGIAHYKYGKDGEKPTIQIWLNGPTVTGKVGVSYETALHELVHAATMSAILLGNKKIAAGTQIAQSVSRLYDVMNATIDAFNKRVTESKSGGKPLTEFEQAIYSRGNNALANADEVLTWALTDKDMQEWLNSVNYKNTAKTIWQALVDAIGKLLGIPVKQNSALAEILSVGEDILNADEKELKSISEQLITKGGEYSALQIQTPTGQKIVTATTPKQQRTTLKDGFNKVVNANYDHLPPMTQKLANNVLNTMSVLPRNLREAALGFLSLHQLNEIYGKIMPSIKKLDDILSFRASDVDERRRALEVSIKKYHEVFKKYTPQQKEKYFDVFNNTTLDQIEPLTVSVKETINSNGQVQRTRTYELKPNPATASDPLVKEFYSMPKDVQEVYLDMRKKYDSYADELENLITKDVTPGTAAKLRTQFELRRLKVYLPLYRQGEFWLAYEDASNEPVVMAFTNERERQLEMQRATKEGAKNIKPYARFEDIVSHTGQPPVGFISNILDTMTKEKVPQAVLDQVYSSYLSLFPAESVRQMYRKRKGFEGFEKDAVEVFANVGSRMANQIGNLKYAKDIDKAVNSIIAEGSANPTMESYDVVKNIVQQTQYMMNPTVNKWSARASSFSYYMYIAGNVSSALINLTQLPIVVYSLLGGKYGFGEAFDAMRQATTMYLNGGKDDNSTFLPDHTFIKGKNISPELKALYDEAVRHAVIRRSTAHELIDMRKHTAGDYVGLKGKIETGLGWVFQNSERANREITLIAAYNLARKKGASPEKARQDAMDLVKSAHGGSLSETGPRYFQGNFLRVMFTFKRFAQSQIYMLGKLFNEAFRNSDEKVRRTAQKQLLGIYGMAFLFAGAQGLPLYGALSLLAGMTMGDDDEPVDIDALITEALGDTVYKGPVNQLLNLDIASRTGFNGMVWRDNPKRLAEVGPVTYVLEQLGGPAYGAALNAQKAVGMISDGYVYRGFETLMPSVAKNLMKGARYVAEGATNKDGVPIVQDVSLYNALMQMGGFSPSDLSEAYARAGAKKTTEKKIMDRRSALLDKLYMAKQDGDFDGIQEANEAINKFNEKNPEKNVSISADTKNRSYKSHKQREREMVDGVHINKNLRRRLDDMYGTADEED
jgi:Large polyvalent protein associated domain 39